MGKGGRFGKYGEQEKLKRLRQKRWDVLPQRIGKKYPNEKADDAEEGLVNEICRVVLQEGIRDGD